jgi:hypothetical protein
MNNMDQKSPDTTTRNPQRAAWIILSSAFTTCCLLAVLIPLSVYWYVTTATEPFSTSVTSVRGVVLIGNPVAELSTSLTDGNSTSVQESTEIATDDTSQAILTFFDDSTLTLYSNTSIILTETRLPRFDSLSSLPARISIEVKQGRVRATSARNRETLDFNISSPHALIQLNQGSFSIETDAELTQVTTRLGQAEVTGDGQTVLLIDGQRAVVQVGNPPSPPLPSAQNLLKNSNFERSDFAETWEIYDINLTEGVTTTVDVVDFLGRPVLQLQSQGQDNIHTETGVIQQVNKDVRDFQSLRVFADVRLLRQSLPGGGQLGSEFPIMLHVAYKDANNNDRDWFHGFYYSPAPENYILYDQPDNSSEPIARYIWYPYESVNLLTTLGPAKPVYIKSIRIYTSGWIYDAMVSNISLLAQE